MNINPELIYEAMKRVGFTRTKSCCDVEEKFCSTDEYKGELRAFSAVLIRLHNEKEKPFAGVGAWFSTGVLGHPMREHAEGKWESAIWPSEQLNDVTRTELVDDTDGENRPIRTFLMLYGGNPNVTVGRMKDHMELSGWNRLWPEWVNDMHGNTHLTKSGAQSWLRYLFYLEPK